MGEEKGGDIMLKKKYVLVFALAFCLTLTLFIAVSTGYDPWVDQDEDGDVDSNDLCLLAGEYGSSGDPTKNVNVTNWPTQPEPKTIIVCENYTLSSCDVMLPFVADVEGYQYFSMFVAWYRPYENAATAYAQASISNMTGASSAASVNLTPSSSGWESDGHMHNVISAPNLRFRVVVPNDSVEFTLVLYCYN